MASVRPRRAPPNRSNGLAMSCHGSAEAATPPHQPAATRARRRDEADPETNKQTNKQVATASSATTTRAASSSEPTARSSPIHRGDDDKGEHARRFVGRHRWRARTATGQGRTKLLPQLRVVSSSSQHRSFSPLARSLPAAGSHGRDWRASCWPCPHRCPLPRLVITSLYCLPACLPDDTQDKSRAIAGRLMCDVQRPREQTGQGGRRA
jgi:hypothetical protein